MNKENLELIIRVNLEEAREYFSDLLTKIDKMKHLTSTKKFELQMMANCALMVEEFRIKDDIDFNLEFVSDLIDKY